MKQSKFISLCVHYLAQTKYLLIVLVLGLSSASTTNAETELDVRPDNKKLEQEYREELNKWMLQAYEGEPDAQFKVGLLFTSQQFDAADYEQAVYWYTQSARQGHVLAQYNLGHQYLTGVGVRRSEKNAMEWWLKAADQGHALAQFNIGRAYYLGIGVKEDHALSKIWFNRAAQNKEPKSIEILAQLGWNDQTPASETTTIAKQTEIDPRLVSSSSEDKLSTLVSKVVPADAKPVDIAPSPVSDAPAVANTEIDTSPMPELAPAIREAAATLPKTITLYTNPGIRSVLIGIVDDRDSLDIIKRGKQWHTVTSKTGFPVWVHGNFINLDTNGANSNSGKGSVNASAVNARSVPIIALGTVVGQLNKGEHITVLEKSKGWYRIVAPTRFKAWVRAEDFEQRSPVVTQQSTAIELEAGPETKWLTKTPDSETTTQTANTTSGSRQLNDNQWLYALPQEYYTLQLASFDNLQKVADFIARYKLENDTKLHRFTSKGKGIEWTYFLYGSYANKQQAELAKSKLGQKTSWIRAVSKLRQNRCLAWKKQLPPPPELNKYCGA